MATLARRLRRLQDQVEELTTLRERLEPLVTTQEAEIKKLKALREDEARAHQEALLMETIKRVAAQRQLVLDIRTPCYECGQPWRPPGQREIGNDPDEDNEIKTLISEGKLQPAGARRPDDRTFPAPTLRSAALAELAKEGA